MALIENLEQDNWQDMLRLFFNLDSSVGRARVGCQGRAWVGATTQQAIACKEEQHPQARSWQCNRVRSAVTQKVNWVNAEIVNV